MTNLLFGRKEKEKLFLKDFQDQNQGKRFLSGIIELMNKEMKRKLKRQIFHLQKKNGENMKKILHRRIRLRKSMKSKSKMEPKVHMNKKKKFLKERQKKNKLKKLNIKLKNLKEKKNSKENYLLIKSKRLKRLKKSNKKSQ